MGCDIHLYVERKVDGAWRSVHEFDDEGDVRYQHQWYSDRNYDAFAILAGVRNGHGFAGIATGDGFHPISEPRGLPVHCDPRIRKVSEQWGVDGHSHSYLTVDELLAFDWSQQTTKYGVVSGVEYEKWDGWRRENGHGPDSYSAGVAGGGVHYIGEAEMKSALHAIRESNKAQGYGAVMAAIEKQLGNTYTRVAWTAPYYRAAGAVCGELLPQLTSLALREGLPFSDVRIVFWFDN